MKRDLSTDAVSFTPSAYSFLRSSRKEEVVWSILSNLSKFLAASNGFLLKELIVTRAELVAPIITSLLTKLAELEVGKTNIPLDNPSEDKALGAFTVPIAPDV